MPTFDCPSREEWVVAQTSLPLQTLQVFSLLKQLIDQLHGKCHVAIDANKLTSCISKTINKGINSTLVCRVEMNGLPVPISNLPRLPLSRNVFYFFDRFENTIK